MQAGLQQRVEELAHLAILLDSADLSGLAALRARATILAAELGQSGARDAAGLAQRIADLAEGLVTRRSEDAESRFRDVRSLLDALKTAVAPPAEVNEFAEHLADFLCEAREYVEESEAALLDLERDPADVERRDAVFRAFHTIKGVAGFLYLDPIASLAHGAEQLLADAQQGRRPLAGAERLTLLGACAMMRRLLDALETAPAPIPAPRSQPRAPERTIRVSADRIDRLVSLANDLTIAHESALQAGVESPDRGAELARAQSRAGELIRQLQTVSASLRMVSPGSIFRRMERLAHDLAHQSGKLVDVVIEGEEVALHSDLMDAVRDPLMHLIRNACDHALEPPEERRAAGKPAAGRIWMRAIARDDSVCIEVADDGRGLPRQRLLDKARALGLASAGAASLSDEDLCRLILLPGMSTAERITETSGRGMGMDIVRRSIESVQGAVEIRSTPGHGTTIVLRLPRTPSRVSAPASDADQRLSR